MIPTQIILATSSTPLENWAHIAEIIIALGSIFSIWFSIKSLRKADWNSNMTAAPSVTMNCTGANFWLSDFPTGGGSWGEPTRYLDPNNKYITFALDFSILNQGRGVALGVRQPKIKCLATSKLERLSIPVSIGVNDEPASFEIYITELHAKWVNLMQNPLEIEVTMDYTNDQGNIFCKSIWSAELKPFDLEDTRLLIRDYGKKIIGANMKVVYG